MDNRVKAKSALKIFKRIGLSKNVRKRADESSEAYGSRITRENPSSAIRNSRKAKTLIREVKREPKYAISPFPTASPHIKLASTMEDAITLFPNARPHWRNHNDSKMRAAAPERKKMG